MLETNAVRQESATSFWSSQDEETRASDEVCVANDATSGELATAKRLRNTAPSSSLPTRETCVLSDDVASVPMCCSVRLAERVVHRAELGARRGGERLARVELGGLEGLCHVDDDPAGRIMFEPTGQTSSVPLMATQTTGTSSFLARSKKGALNGANFDTCSAASLHRSASKPMRVPSGKIATELPAANCVAAFSRSSPVEPLTVPQPLFLFLSNLTARSPARFIAQPPKGTLKRSYFATYLVSSGSIADPSAKGSMKERWFATTKTPFLPLTTSLGGRHDVAVLVTEMPGTYRDGGAAESSRNRYPFQNSSLVGDATNQPKV
eukprot:CAMPEP_0185713388 /NCGR_PEP_ID=MMETSP1164-20130828/36733_1 /TAXON_ID=1104430 /ORGANISM="Chrysoreinhardia sp, Strain CCMP2950" /LENGTH=322 /DNA_ID=CAMNT_0028380959 /DNA_START=129 /DNA_END=1099 /DNA_ORIENTATION=-